METVFLVKLKANRKLLQNFTGFNKNLSYGDLFREGRKLEAQEFFTPS